MLRKTESANVVRLCEESSTGLESCPNTVQTVLELCPQGDLQCLLSKRGFKEADARVVLNPIVAGVVHIHSCEIAHLDLKPENILISTSFGLKIADMGASRQIHEKPTGCGTLQFMSPEMHRMYFSPMSEIGRTADGAIPVDLRLCDMWSLGVLMFTVVCGFPPFGRPCQQDMHQRHFFSDTRERVYAHWNNRLKSNGQEQLSPLFIDLLEALLLLNPTDRLSVDQVIVHPWMTLGLGDITQSSIVVSLEDIIKDRIEYSPEQMY